MHKKSLSGFHRRLHDWYERYGRRDLPWRNTRDTYAIYVSEVMLQQTQVTTVLSRYYFPFLERFPTLAALASAPQDDVLRAWQGLGYYSRAMNLHKAAKACQEALPETVEQLQALPGIGRNTAHAVAAFGHHQPVPVMEANVRRVLARIFALQAPMEKELWDKAALLLDTANPFDYNQAMMDIGALVCTKRAPHCQECPAQAICQGKTAPQDYPAAKAKKTPPVRKKRIVVFCNAEGKYYATPRHSRFLGGLYHFVETGEEVSHITFNNKRYSLAIYPIGHIHQQYSHFTLEADVYIINAGRRSGTHWHSLEQLQQLPMSMAEQKILGLMLKSLDQLQSRGSRG